MIAVRWSDFGVFALALVALVGMFLGPTSTTAFLSVTTLSSQPRHTTAATRDGSSTSRRSVAVAGERSRRSALFGIKRKVENMETVNAYRNLLLQHRNQLHSPTVQANDVDTSFQFSGKVVDPGTGGLMGALGKDVDSLMAMIEKNKQRSAEVAAAMAAEQATRDLGGGISGDEGAGKDYEGEDADDGVAAERATEP